MFKAQFLGYNFYKIYKISHFPTMFTTCDKIESDTCHHVTYSFMKLIKRLALVHFLTVISKDFIFYDNLYILYLNKYISKLKKNMLNFATIEFCIMHTSIIA